jgi:predicted RNA-binding Zn-ribbon protein involved in translation (DUF1610 family)
MSQTFKRTIEDFVCIHCGQEVRGDGYTNHCPNCLWSRHVDLNPGDRAATCLGMMEPIGLVISGQDWIIVHQCQLCGKTIKNKAREADNRTVLVALSNKILPNIK